MKSSLNDKHLQLTFHNQLIAATVQADEQRLKQVLLNLLNNAVKFTPDGGAIGLEVNSDEISQTTYFTVWDTGIGISQESIKKLFKPFVQLDSRLARHYQGSGLGLFLIYHLVKLHGGSVSITSRINQGSRFTIALPWISPYQSTLPLFPTTPNLPTATLLLAESNQTTLAGLIDYLTLKGYKVILAKNGNEALEKVKTITFDLLLITLQLEGINAVDVIRSWRADYQLASIPIIAMTALSIPGDKEESLAAGANEYLVKPLHLKQLVQLFEQLIQCRQTSIIGKF
jgi:CheY-like chemotaxis protein